MDSAYWRLLSEEYELEDRAVDFKSSGEFLLNLSGLKFKNNVHNILFAKDNKLFRKCVLFNQSFGFRHLRSRI